MSDPHRLRARFPDLALALAIFAATVSYLALLPHHLNPADEANYLYDAKRVVSGQIPYRDYFTFITPGFMYLVAALFWVFGTTMETARLFAAAVHGVIAALVFLTCRRLDIRRGLCLLAALAHLVLAQPAWPIASQHWLSTLLCALLLYIAAAQGRDRRLWLIALGIVLGLLNSVQQQRGLFMAAGLAGWLVLDVTVQRRFAPRSPPMPLRAQLIWLATGVSIVMLPLGLHIIATAGIGSVWRDLVVFPLVNYRARHDYTWGYIGLMSRWQGSFTFPRVLRYLPAVFAVSLPRLVWLWLRRERREQAAVLTLLLTFCAASMLSIAYLPDFIHIAFIAPVFIVTVAESLEWSCRQIPAAGSWGRRAGWVAVAAVLLAGAARLYDNRARLQAAFPLSRETAFGRIDFRTADEAAIYDQLRTLLRERPSRYLYVYPGLSHLYLMLDVDNPTPHAYYSVAFHGPVHFQIVLDRLTEAAPSYIVIVSALVAPDDPLVGWVRQRYDPVGEQRPGAQVIFRRRNDDRPALSSCATSSGWSG